MIYMVRVDIDAVPIVSTDLETMKAYCKVSDISEDYIVSLDDIAERKSYYLKAADSLIPAYKFFEVNSGEFEYKKTMVSPTTTDIFRIDKDTGLAHALVVTNDEKQAFEIFKVNMKEFLSSDANGLKLHLGLNT